MGTGEMMSICEHQKLWGKCDTCLRARIGVLEAALSEGRTVELESTLKGFANLLSLIHARVLTQGSSPYVKAEFAKDAEQKLSALYQMCREDAGRRCWCGAHDGTVFDADD